MSRPGQSARKIKDDFYLSRVLFGLVGIGGMFICLLLIRSFNKAGAIGGVIFLIIVIKIIAAIVDSNTRSCKKSERKAERGAQAEEVVGKILNELTGDYAVFHDVSTGYGDIDHIVLSREYGVFLLETKSHYGDVVVRNGKLLIKGRPPEKDFIKQTISNTMWLKKHIKQKTGLEIWIQPIIVFTNAFVKEWKPVRGILLRNKKFLISTIKKSRVNVNAMSKLWEAQQRAGLF